MWRLVALAFVVYLTPMTLTMLVVLASEWTVPCNEPLQKHWADWATGNTWQRSSPPHNATLIACWITRCATL